MKVDEFKLKFLKFGNNIINSYFPNNTITDRAASSMLKYILKNKIDEMDSVLALFSKNGEIDAQDFVDYLKKDMIGSGIKFNFHDYVSDDNIIKSLLPNRTLLIKAEDLDAFV